MNKVKDVLERVLLEKRMTQKELALKLGISESYVTQLLQGKKQASLKLTRLIAFTFPDQTSPVAEIHETPEAYGRAAHPDPEIEAVVRLMEGMDADTKKDIRLSVEKEKLLRDLLKQREDREAG